MPQDQLVVHEAREHNLKNITVAMPRDRLVVITGLSGSGKSSLAFDTIYAEGQRRYVESLSAYARQFLGLMEKPDVGYIEGLSPAISIDQKGTSRNPRSTVGTVTEIYDYLRLLYARAGHPHCPECGREISQQSVQQIVDSVLALPDGSRLLVLAPLIRDRKGEHRHVFDEVRKAGFVRVRVNGVTRDVDDEIQLDRYKQHTIEAVVDRLIVHADDMDRQRFADSIETALKLGSGIVLISHTLPDAADGASSGDREPQETLYSEHFSCVHCGISVGEIEPRTFSFNTPYGACPACTGLGSILRVDPDLVVPNPDLSLAEGTIAPWSNTSNGDSYYLQLVRGVARQYHIDLHTPARDWTPAQRQVLLYGSGDESVVVDFATRQGSGRTYDTTYEGVIPNLERRYKETDSDYIRAKIQEYMTVTPCPTCQGKRLKPEALAVTVDGANIVQVAEQPVKEARRWVERLQGNGAPTPLSTREQIIA
ncbi:MAG: excinuclease ABC subunit UvrA, partial [Chloroflexi bacterium]|nr:excinuclease ABC subunit UvrA [Chloroflexota bacterium]